MSVPTHNNITAKQAYVDTEIDNHMVGEYLDSGKNNTRQMSQLPRNPTSMEDKHGIFIGSSFPDFPSPTNGSGKKLMFQKTSMP